LIGAKLPQNPMGEGEFATWLVAEMSSAGSGTTAQKKISRRRTAVGEFGFRVGRDCEGVMELTSPSAQ
jgi:hypothetical protein